MIDSLEDVAGESFGTRADGPAVENGSLAKTEVYFLGAGDKASDNVSGRTGDGSGGTLTGLVVEAVLGPSFWNGAVESERFSWLSDI